MTLQIVEEPLSQEGALLRVRGRLDAVTAPDLKERLKQLAAGGHVHLVLDMTTVSFVDSAGLAALVSGLKVTREAGGTIKLAGLGRQARTAFEVTLLDRVFEFYPDADAALRTLPAP